VRVVPGVALVPGVRVVGHGRGALGVARVLRVVMACVALVRVVLGVRLVLAGAHRVLLWSFPQINTPRGYLQGGTATRFPLFRIGVHQRSANTMAPFREGLL
jgi:hypothetical protein